MADNKCYLLGLPSELRVSIWELILQPITMSVPIGSDDDPRTDPPKILQVNQITRSETLPIYYGQTTFDLGYLTRLHERIGDFGDWLHSIGEDAVQNLRHLRVRCPWMLPLLQLGYRALDIMPTSEAKIMSWYVDPRLPFVKSHMSLKREAGPLAKGFEAKLEMEIREVQKGLVDRGLSPRDWQRLLQFIGERRYSWRFGADPGSVV
ncbi:hypothetical protein LTR97_000328 [Elasticomyces elasticus]|uniref:Uncharacterized protein n=1 Tax=Elasticomyces elasticus TaxID=574655 RepID=A0AAN7WK61_9PEZI|nr:hypothetical protein LTR97_000328 [Elasticomyces elasticus]